MRMNEQVSHGVLKIVLPLPNPPLRKGRGLDFSVSPQYIGGTKGGKQSYLISLYGYATLRYQTASN
jgi:hypothetical protein